MDKINIEKFNRFKRSSIDNFRLRNKFKLDIEKTNKASEEVDLQKIPEIKPNNLQNQKENSDKEKNFDKRISENKIKLNDKSKNTNLFKNFLDNLFPKLRVIN